MQIVASGLKVVRYGVYQRNADEGGGDMTRRDGSSVEYVELLDADSAHDGGVRRFTLDPSINGSRADVGATVNVVLRDWVEPDAAISGRTGRAYVRGKRRNVLIAFAKPSQS